MRKYIITAELRDLELKVHKGKISYSRMIEILCEKADNYAKRYHEKELNKSHQDAVSGSVAFVKWIEEKMCRDNWFRYDDKAGKWYVYLKGHLTTEELYELYLTTDH